MSQNESVKIVAATYTKCRLYLILGNCFFYVTRFSYFQNVTHDNHSNGNCAFTINCDKTIASLQLMILLRNQKVEKL